MDRQLISRAAQQLKPLKVLLTDSKVKTLDEIDLFQITYELESYKAARELLVHLPEDEQSNFKFLYVYKYEIGLRGVKSEKEIPNTEQEPVFEITASYKAYYSSDTELTEDSAKEFGKFNVGHTVWPYWREYVHSISARVGLNTIEVPFYTISD